MQKTLYDATSPVTTFEIPENVRGFVEALLKSAKETYPDHQKSREDMIFQTLVLKLSKSDELLEQAVALSQDMLNSLRMLMDAFKTIRGH